MPITEYRVEPFKSLLGRVDDHIVRADNKDIGRIFHDRGDPRYYGPYNGVAYPTLDRAVSALILSHVTTRSKKYVSPHQARQLWIEALRSGEYEQTTSYLKRGDTFCCLGVACDVAMQHGVQLEVEQIADDVTAFNGQTLGLPPEVMGWLGIVGAEGALVNHVNGQSCLSQLNDYMKYDFDQIADVIERGDVKVTHVS
jgi:hypothetical protein